MPGITLAKGTVVGANAVVTKNTMPYSIVVGVPSKILRFRDDTPINTHITKEK